MKIDIHTHTKKCKSGDAPTREIASADFCEAGVILHNDTEYPARHEALVTKSQWDKANKALVEKQAPQSPSP